MERRTHNGRETAYRRVGDSTDSTVCYVHGSGGTHGVWANQYARGRPSVALDLSGHGRSEDVDTPAGPETLAAYADDVVAVCERTGATVLAGNSLGGAVAQYVALERDVDLDGLVLVGTGPVLEVEDGLKSLLAPDGDFEKAVEVLHRPGLLFSDPDPDLVADSERAMREVGRRVTERDFLTCDRFDVRDRLDAIPVPTLVLHGEDDGLTPPELHEELEAGISDAERVEIPGAAHMPFLERPAAFNRAVDEFLDRL
jgi:pimeloyl-ACP methyl ester carboxylesterase